MARSDSQRLQNDLATLRMLLGSDLPFEWVDVRGMFSLGVAALVPAITCLAGGRAVWLLLASAAPWLAILGYFLIRNYLGASPARPCPAAKRREYRVGVPIMLLSLPLVYGFVQWAIAAGAPNKVANACVMVFLGLSLLYQGLLETGRRASLFVAVPAIMAGLLWPFVSRVELWAVLWLATGLGMLAAAAYMRWQLNSSRMPETSLAEGDMADGAD